MVKIILLVEVFKRIRNCTKINQFGRKSEPCHATGGSLSRANPSRTGRIASQFGWDLFCFWGAVVSFSIGIELSVSTINPRHTFGAYAAYSQCSFSARIPRLNKSLTRHTVPLLMLKVIYN
jgi:hypothetical protein